MSETLGFLRNVLLSLFSAVVVGGLLIAVQAVLGGESGIFVASLPSYAAAAALAFAWGARRLADFPDEGVRALASRAGWLYILSGLLWFSTDPSLRDVAPASTVDLVLSFGLGVSIFLANAGLISAIARLGTVGDQPWLPKALGARRWLYTSLIIAVVVEVAVRSGSFAPEVLIVGRYASLAMGVGFTVLVVRLLHAASRAE